MGPANENELEVGYKGDKNVTHRVRYQIELKVEIYAPTTPSGCQCPLKLGSTSSLVPSTFDAIALRPARILTRLRFSGHSLNVESECRGRLECDERRPVGEERHVGELESGPAPTARLALGDDLRWQALHG